MPAIVIALDGTAICEIHATGVHAFERRQASRVDVNRDDSRPFRREEPCGGATYSLARGSNDCRLPIQSLHIRGAPI
jgi:hypothetical protein